MFSYDLVNEGTKKEYEALLRSWGLAFLIWRAKAPNRKTQPFEQVFKMWWFQRGPVNVKTADLPRLRRELGEFIELTMLTEEPDGATAAV